MNTFEANLFWLSEKKLKVNKQYLMKINTGEYNIFISEVSKVIDTNNLKLEIANDNSNIQIVISGNINELKKSEEIFINNGIKKFVILNVSAAFHSKYMLAAQNELSNDIENFLFEAKKLNNLQNSAIYEDQILIIP